ncbi:unnamed protein product [Prunus armeniaca]|uniref:Uncharacterized protein n=1 Tax=Prunus armeniaca TaxID=36596 RepID=A0A6J5WRD2_PRUAR|nr:unnamed protein product [Prunus armeniaca]
MAQPFPFELGEFGGSLEMSNYGQAPRCQFCNSEMRLGISKTNSTRGRRFWKCSRSYQYQDAIANKEEYEDEQGEYEEEM